MSPRRAFKFEFRFRVVLEDDCVPPPDFVTFMRKCFNEYENNKRVMNIAGYSLPIGISEDYQYDIYFSYRFSSWGWGTWRRLKGDENMFNQIQNSDKLRRRVERAGPDLISTLKNKFKKKSTLGQFIGQLILHKIMGFV